MAINFMGKWRSTNGGRNMRGPRVEYLAGYAEAVNEDRALWLRVGYCRFASRHFCRWPR